MDISCLSIKKELELLYDMPFSVKYIKEYNDPLYIISPENELDELFDVTILYRQNIRMIIEIRPQKYAASLLNDMQHANEYKRDLFLKYVQLFKEKNTKVELFVNDQSCDPENNMVWSGHWKKFRIRATKIAVNELEKRDFNEVVETIEWAKLSVGMILSLLTIEYSDDEEKKHSEGKKSQVLLTKYERNPVNRELCLAANGYSCKICGLDFEKVYGEIGYHFIHVHHIEKVSSFGGEYFLNPEKDLIPICPNCHAMLHRVDPPMKPEDLKQIFLENIVQQPKGDQ